MNHSDIIMYYEYVFFKRVICLSNDSALRLSLYIYLDGFF